MLKIKNSLFDITSLSVIYELTFSHNIYPKNVVYTFGGNKIQEIDCDLFICMLTMKSVNHVDPSFCQLIQPTQGYTLICG
jgi:hypothetical protein